MNGKHRILRVTGGRVAYANTSEIADEAIRDALRFIARDLDLNHTVVHFRRYGRAQSLGRAYRTIPAMANMEGLNRYQWRYLIIVRDAYGWFNTLAHEAKHVEQFRERLRISETAAYAYADWMENRYRNERPAISEPLARTA